MEPASSRPPSRPASPRRPRTPPPPLDPRSLDELALAYVARFATTRAKLLAYLARKLRERGWAAPDAGPDGGSDGEGAGDPGAVPDLAGIAARLVELGYVDDAAYARAKAGGLARRGYGARRIGAALHAAGVEAGVREPVLPDPGAARQAALVLAARRRFGPFGGPARADKGAGDPRRVRDRQIAAMLRAGHPMDIVRELVDAPSVAAAEAWAAALDRDGDRPGPVGWED